MKKTVLFNLILSALLLVGCGTSGSSGRNSSQEEYSFSYSSQKQTSYAGNVEVHIKFISGQTTTVEIEKGKKFIVSEHFEGFKAYTDDFYSKEYSPSNLKEEITLYLREDDGKNVLAIYDIIDNVPTRTIIGTYDYQSGLYPSDFEFQLYTNEGCTSPINLNEEILVPTQGLKLYRKGKTNCDYFCLTMVHYLDGIYDKQDDYVRAVDYLISGYALKYNSGVPYNAWEYTTFKFNDGQNVDENTWYSFRTADQVIVNCYINEGKYRRINVYNYDDGTLLGIIPWSIESSFFGTVPGYRYSGVIEYDFQNGIARVANVSKLISCVYCRVYNGHVVQTWTNYAYQSEGFNFEYQEAPYYFDIGLTQTVEHTRYHTDITVYQEYNPNN